jgi:hypothetical protein
MAQMKKKIDKNGLIWQKYIHTSSGTVTTLGNDPGVMLLVVFRQYPMPTHAVGCCG